MTVLADAYDAFLFDLDGVLYRGSEVVPEPRKRSPDCVRRASTWRSSRTTPAGPPRSSPACSAGSASLPRATRSRPRRSVTAHVLAARGVTEAFVVGEEGILSALRDAGIALADAGADRTEAVVVGWDREVDYEKLCRASLLVQRGAVLVRHERRRVLPRRRRELARRGRAARRRRDDHGCARRGVRQAGASHHAGGARASRGRHAARDRRSHGDRHRRRGRPGMGLAPRPHRHHRARGPRRLAASSPRSSARTFRALFAPSAP